jgi:hypothetical protein
MSIPFQRQIERHGHLSRQNRASLSRLTDRPEDNAEGGSLGNAHGVSVGLSRPSDDELDAYGGRGAEGEMFRTRGGSPRSL